MKNIYKYFFVFTLLFLTVGCEDGFDELNTNKVDPIAVDPAFLVNNAILGLGLPNGTLYYELAIVQQIVTPFTGVLTGGNFNQESGSAADLWNDYYQNVIKYTRDAIASLADSPERSNLLNMSRILQAYAFMVLTDTYGDIPYSQGGIGLTEQIVFPSYDSQESIYTDIISELTAASAALNASGGDESEVLFAGDITKWKEFGNSLLLRAGMRLSEVNPSLAQSTVAAAFAAGVISSNDNNAMILHDANYGFGIGNTLNSNESANFFLVDSFVDYLQGNNDPRLGSIAVRYDGATNASEQTSDVRNTDPGVQIGMPLGFDSGGIVGQATTDGLASFYEYSQADRERQASFLAPTYIVTYAQTQLTLAEAALKGWVTGDAETFYNAGVRAHMEQMALSSADSAIPSGDIDAYLAANPFDSTEEQIGEQYWVACFLNGPEAFANFRRTGYPALTPNPFVGQDITGDFINRLIYPDSEASVNPENLNAAIANQGPDNLDTNVWWDE